MKGFDYSENGAYFITICTEKRKKILCDIVGQDIICSFKSVTTIECRKNGLDSNKLFQTSFYDHVIRDEEDYRNHYTYIDSNPLKWQEDEYYENPEE